MRVLLRNEASRYPLLGPRCAEILHSVQDDTGALSVYQGYPAHRNGRTASLASGGGLPSPHKGWG